MGRTRSGNQFFVFLCTPSEKATISDMPAGLTPDMGMRRSGGSGDLRQGNLTRSASVATMEPVAAMTLLRSCQLFRHPPMTDLIGELQGREIIIELTDFADRALVDRHVNRLERRAGRCVLGVHLRPRGRQVEAGWATSGGAQKSPASLARREPSRSEQRMPASRHSNSRYITNFTRLSADKRLIAVEIGVAGYVAD